MAVLTAYPGLLAGDGYPYMAAHGALLTTGTVYFVNSAAGSDDNDGIDPDRPLATLAQGIAKAAADDTVVLMPGHTETIATVVTLSNAGVTVMGLGEGYRRPVLTGSGTVDVISVEAASCVLKNLRLVGAAADVTALINIAAADLYVENCILQQAETPTMAVTIADGGDRFYFRGCKFRATANGPDAAFDFESSGSDDWIVEDCFFNYLPNGLDVAVFRANVDTTSGGVIKNCVAIGLDAGALFVDFNSSSAVGEGLIVDSTWQHRAAATIANGVDLGGYGTAYTSVSASDGPNRGAPLPATTAS